MAAETSDQILSRFARAKAAMKVICFGEEMQDKECPEVLWSQYGLIDTNEIVVIAKFRALEFAIAGPSPLIYPAMADRVFGMDVADIEFAHSLADRLWPVVRLHATGQAIRWVDVGAMVRHFHFNDAGWPSAELSCEACTWQGRVDEALMEDSPMWRIAKCPRCPEPRTLAIIVYPSLHESIEAGERLVIRDRRH